MSASPARAEEFQTMWSTIWSIYKAGIIALAVALGLGAAALVVLNIREAHIRCPRPQTDEGIQTREALVV